MKHAVLGATGDIGSLLVQELAGRGERVRALSRTVPAIKRPDVEYAAADAIDRDQLLTATKDVDVLYVVLSVPYTTADWERIWPLIARNVLDVAQANNCKLVFLDNVYMYGKVDGPMTEETPFAPVSKKGFVRAEIAARLEAAIKSGKVRGTIGRSADFYGPGSRISSQFFQDTLVGKAYWLGRTDVLRTWNFTSDNARALALLGTDERADGQVWHLPAAPAMKGTEFIALAASILDRPLETVLVPAPDAESRADFAAAMPELAEMMYQYENDYIFDSSKFQHTFGMAPTPYADGFRHVYDVLNR